MRVVVALDGSNVGEGALAAIAPWARATAAEVHLLTVLNPGRIHDTLKAETVSTPALEGGAQGAFAPTATVVKHKTIEDRTQAMARAREDAEGYLHAMAHRYLPGTVVNIGVQWADHPAEAIADFAQAVKSELIVMGTHGRRGVSHALLGSVAEEVIRLAPVPVTVVRGGLARVSEPETAVGAEKATIQSGAGGKERLLSYLRHEGAPFMLQHHPLAYSANELAAAQHIPADMVAKTVGLILEGDYALAVLPATSHVDLGALHAVTGKEHIRIAHEAELALLFPDCEPGAVHPFGNLYQIPVYADTTLAEARNIAFPAGTHTDALYITYADYARLAKPTVADIRQEA